MPTAEELAILQRYGYVRSGDFWYPPGWGQVRLPFKR